MIAQLDCDIFVASPDTDTTPKKYQAFYAAASTMSSAIRGLGYQELPPSKSVSYMEPSLAVAPADPTTSISNEMLNPVEGANAWKTCLMVMKVSGGLDLNTSDDAWLRDAFKLEKLGKLSRALDIVYETIDQWLY